MKATKENLELIGKQLERLMVKSFPPRDDAAKKEYIAVLLASAVSPSHVKIIVDEILYTEGDFPEPATFRRVAGSTRDLEYLADPDCPLCGGCGQIITSLTYPFGAQLIRSSGAKKCSCWANRLPPEWKKDQGEA